MKLGYSHPHFILFKQGENFLVCNRIKISNDNKFLFMLVIFFCPNSKSPSIPASFLILSVSAVATPSKELKYSAVKVSDTPQT